MDKIIKILFFALVVKPVVFVVIGLNIKNRSKLPTKGPAVIAANHNSHLDTLVIMSLYPLSQIDKIRPLAAADYFLKNRFIAWIALKCIGIIPLDRSGNTPLDKKFEEAHKALDRGEILIIFPEGSRGKPEQMSRLKKGLYYLLKEHKNIPVIPIYMRGLGYALPKGEALFVPFNCNVNIGDSICKYESANELNASLDTFFKSEISS